MSPLPTPVICPQAVPKGSGTRVEPWALHQGRGPEPPCLVVGAAACRWR